MGVAQEKCTEEDHSCKIEKGSILAPQNRYLKLSQSSTPMMPHIFSFCLLAEKMASN